MPQVSIIMPIFNGAEQLAAAIKSVQKQSFADWELLVIDDASTDATAALLSKFAELDSRVRIFRNRKNMGLTWNLNFGLAEAAGEFLARLDCDDYWLNADKLKNQAGFLQAKPRAGLVGTWAEFHSGDGKLLYTFRPPVSDEQIRSELLGRNCFVHSSILARKSAMLAAGGYRETENFVEDYGLWLRMGEKCELANLPEADVYYRVSPAGITRTKNREQIKNALALIREHRKAYPGYLAAWCKWQAQRLLPGALLLRLKSS